MNSLLFILASISASSLAHVLLKKGMMLSETRRLPGDKIADQLGAVGFQFWVPAGMFLHVLALGLWLIALRKADISFAYPFLSLGYIFVTLLAVFWLGETLNQWRVIGMFLIIFGLIVLSLGER